MIQEATRVAVKCFLRENMSSSAEVSQRGQIAPHSSTPKRINNLLNSSNTRLEGLKLLDSFLPQCPDEDFLNFCISWMQNCCKVDGFTNNRHCAAHLLCHLFKISSKYPGLKKSVSFFVTTRYFDFFFKYLLNSEAGWTCTETCLLLYRGACGPFQEGLEKHLTTEIERGVIISSVIGRCFALLPCTGGGGNEGMTYKGNWKSQFVKFLSFCHSILNDLFGDVEDIQQGHGTPALWHERNKQERNVEQLAIRLHNYSDVLGFMLLNQYPAPKNIPSDLVFQLICRGLALNPKAAGKLLTADAMSLQKVLPDVHHSFASLLKAVIVTCKNQLLPYSRLIGKLIKQSLQWTESDITYENEKSFGRLRTTTYETLCDWLAVARSGSCIELISDVVVTSAVNDITPKKGVVSLKEAKLQNQSKHSEQTCQTVATADGKLCRAALRAVQFLLKFSGVLIKPEVHKFLQEVVVKLIVEIQKSSAPDVVAPFADPSCRSELYALLLELVHHPCPKWPPPTNFALRLFDRGVNDVSPQVSLFCSAAINFATIIIHPQYDNGGFPLRDPLGVRTRTEEVPAGLVNEEAIPLPSPVQSEAVQEDTLGGTRENSKESSETDASNQPNDTNEVSEMPSDEDSRNTVMFSKNFDEAAKEPDEGEAHESGRRKGESVAEDDGNAKRRRTSPADQAREKTPSLGSDEGEARESGRRKGESVAEDDGNAKRRRTSPADQAREKTPSLGSDEGEARESGRRKGESVAEDDGNAKRRRTSPADQAREKTPSPARENSPSIPSETPESGKMKKLVEKSHARDSPRPESVSPESTNEDSHPKGRYFLRSKTKGSSEEPEETSKGTNSPESLKCTPAKSLAKTPTGVQNSKKRRRTGALSKVGSSTETEDKTAEKNILDEEEDIRAAFDDSFVD